MRVRRLLFCTITQEPGHGGIARLSAVLWKVLQNRTGDSWKLLVASTSETGQITSIGKLVFGFQVLWGQISGGYDAVFFDHLGLARVQNFVPSVFRRPYGVFLHSIEAWNSLNGGRLRALSNASLRVANSNYTAKRVSAAHPTAGLIDICHLTLGLEPHVTVTKELPSVVDETLLSQIRRHSVLIVGRMMSQERHKGHDELIGAWPFVLREVPEAQLVIVGSGDDVERLQMLVQRTNIAASVLFAGHVSDKTLTAIYRRVAVFAMPSYAEGFGLVYLEAMANGLPCLGSVHDAAGEIITNGETGFLVDQDDSKELASRIVTLLQDPDLRAQFGRNGQERLRVWFSFGRFERRVGEVLEKLEA